MYWHLEQHAAAAKSWYLRTKVLYIVSNDYNLIHQWHFKSWPTIARLHVLTVVLPKVQVCWEVTEHF
jgi:hypothetical protein